MFIAISRYKYVYISEAFRYNVSAPNFLMILSVFTFLIYDVCLEVIMKVPIFVQLKSSLLIVSEIKLTNSKHILDMGLGESARHKDQFRLVPSNRLAMYCVALEKKFENW